MLLKALPQKEFSREYNADTERWEVYTRSKNIPTECRIKYPEKGAMYFNVYLESARYLKRIDQYFCIYKEF